MMYNRVLSSITETVQERYESDPISGGRSSSTTLGRDDNGHFVSFLSEDENKLITKTYFEDEVSGYLDELVTCAQNNCSLQDQTDLSTQLVLFIEEEPTLYINTSVDFHVNSEILEPYLSDFSTDDSSVHNVNPENVTKLDLTYDPIWKSSDSTCYYKTKEPHKPYGNIDSLEDYIDRMSDKPSVEEDELRDTEYYKSHYHPSKETVFSQIRNDCLNELSEFCDIPKTTFNLQPTRMIIRRGEKSEVTLTDISKGEVISDLVQ